MRTTIIIPFIAVLIVLFVFGCTAQESGLAEPDSNATRILFEAEQTTVTHEGLSLASGEIAQFLVPADVGDQYTFQIDLDQHMQLANEVRHPNGEQLMTGHGRMLEWRSSRTTSGDFRVILTNEQADAITYGITATRTLPTDDQIALDDVLAEFADTGVTVEHVPSTQRPTVFDELYGREVATREILHVDQPQQRVDVYIFADEQIALEATEAIEPGASQLVRGSGDQADIVPLDIQSGSIPMWWQNGRFMFSMTGPDADLEQKLTTVLGEPLGATGADAVNIRLNNRTDSTLTNGRIWSGANEVVLPDVVPGMSGYHTLAMDDVLAVSTEYQGQSLTSEVAALPPGDYTLDLLVVDDNQLLARPFNDRDFDIAADLIDQNWLWQHTDLVDGSRFVPVSGDIEPSYLRFGTDATSNTGESGLLYGGNMGCNSMGGTYFVNSNGDLLLSGVSSTDMLCEEEAAMDSDEFWFERALSIYRYTIDGDTLRLFAANGDTFVFTQEAAISDENRIYRSIISEWGNDAPILVVAESAAGQPDATPDDIRATLTELFGTGPSDMQAETVDDFLARNATPTPLTDVLTLDADVVFVDPAELDALFADGSEAGWEAIADQYNGAQQIFTLSLPGFNAAGDQAIVYYGVRYPGFNGGYYALKSNSGDSWRGGSASQAWSEGD